jgi:hypothetical protein
MNKPVLVSSDNYHEIWEYNGKKLHVDKKYTIGIGFVPETYWFNDDFYHSHAPTYGHMYSIHGKYYDDNDYISLEKWCRAVGFIE